MFPLNSVDGDMQCVDVTIVDDGCLEPSENFTVSLSNLISTGLASIGTPSSAVVNLADSTGTGNKAVQLIFKYTSVGSEIVEKLYCTSQKCGAPLRHRCNSLQVRGPVYYIVHST